MKKGYVFGMLLTWIALVVLFVMRSPEIIQAAEEFGAAVTATPAPTPVYRAPGELSPEELERLAAYTALWQPLKADVSAAANLAHAALRDEQNGNDTWRDAIAPAVDSLEAGMTLVNALNEKLSTDKGVPGNSDIRGDITDKVTEWTALLIQAQALRKRVR